MKCSPHRKCTLVPHNWFESWTVPPAPPPPTKTHTHTHNMAVPLDGLVALCSICWILYYDATLKTIGVFWRVTPWYGMRCFYIRSRGIVLPWRWRKLVLPKRWYLSTKLRGFIFRDILQMPVSLCLWVFLTFKTWPWRSDCNSDDWKPHPFRDA
jgi:hypothetical protein